MFCDLDKEFTIHIYMYTLLGVYYELRKLLRSRKKDYFKIKKVASR